jgi:hypothetical protein
MYHVMIISASGTTMISRTVEDFMQATAIAEGMVIALNLTGTTETYKVGIIPKGFSLDLDR